MGLRYLYLHGFASGPQSRKATALRAALWGAGQELETPALDEGDFEHLTVSRQLRLLERVLGGDPAVLIGSSLGGYLAALYAARHPEVVRLVLLAPAFGFLDLWRAGLTAERWQEWERSGSIDVYHYGAGQDRPLAFELARDAAQYEAYPAVDRPTLLFHGFHDTVVPVSRAEEYARQRSGVTLRLLESGHELTDVLDAIAAETVAFLAESGSQVR